MSEEATTTTEAVPEAPPLEGFDEAVANVFGPADQPAPEPAKATEEAEPEAPAEPEKPKEDPRLAAKLNAAVRAEKKLASLRAETAQLESAKQQLSPMLQMLEQVNKEFGSPEKFAEAIKFAKQVQGAKGSPTELLRLAETEPKDFLENLANEHEPAVLFQRMQADFQKQLESVREDFKQQLAAERAQAEQKVAQQQLEQATQQAQQAFVDHVAEKADAYPHLVAEFSPDEIAEKGLEIAQLHSAAYRSRFGEDPSDDVIAEYLEEQAKARAEKRSAWLQRIGKAAPKPGEGGSDSEKQGRPPVKAEVPRTTTSRGASSNHTSPAREWSQEWADAESLRLIEAGRVGKLKTG